MLSFSTVATTEWKLHELDTIVDEFDSELGDAIKVVKMGSKCDYPNLVLHVAGKSIVTMREIIYLCAFGFPDGALSLARNLYEQFIVLCFFENKVESEDFREYVQNYYIDHNLKLYTALKFEYTHFGGTQKEIDDCKKALAEWKGKTSRKTNQSFWWSGRSSFRGLAEYIAQENDEKNRGFLDLLFYTYKRASVALHSSSLGNTLRLGNPVGYVGVNTAPTMEGLDIPLWFAVSSFTMIVGTGCRVFGLEYSRYKERLNKLIIYYHHYQQTGAEETQNA